LDDDTIYILKKWKERQLKHGVTKFILTTTERPLVRGTVNNIVNRYADAAGVKRIQSKGLRHSHASYLIIQHNIDILVVSQRLVHASAEITLKHYAHLWNRIDTVVAEAITGDIDINIRVKILIGLYGNQHVKN